MKGSHWPNCTLKACAVKELVHSGAPSSYVKLGCKTNKSLPEPCKDVTLAEDKLKIFFSQIIIGNKTCLFSNK